MNIGNISLEQYAGVFLYAFTRITSLFMAAPFFSSKTIPARIKIVVGFMITILILPMLPTSGLPEAFSIAGMVILLQQILIGVSIGLIFQFLFQISVVAGQIVAMQSGLGFASIVDPQSHENLPVISEFYLITTLLLFLIMNGHMYLISLIVKSFTIAPIGTFVHSSTSFLEIVSYFGDIFSGALAIAIPAIVALLIVNTTLAIMTKAAPQLNIFTIGFPIMLIIGLFIMYLSYGEFVDQTENVLSRGYVETLEFVGKAYG